MKPQVRTWLRTGHFATGQSRDEGFADLNLGRPGRFSRGQETMTLWRSGWIGNFASTGRLGDPVGHFGLHDLA